MTRLSMNAVTTYRWSFEEDVTHFGEAGYDAIGLWNRKIGDFGEERAVELLRDAQLRVSSLSWVGGFTGADAASAAENVREALDAIDLAAELGADCLVVHTGGANGHTKRHAGRLVRTAMDWLVPHAERMGVTLAVQPMRAACAGEWTILEDVGSAAALIAQYDTPALRMVLDSRHFPALGEGDLTARELASLLAVVQIADYARPRGGDHDRLPLGEGQAPLAGFVTELRDAGYEGAWEVKLYGPRIETRDYRGLIQHSHRQLASLLTNPVSPRQRSESPACNATWLSTTA